MKRAAFARWTGLPCGVRACSHERAQIVGPGRPLPHLRVVRVAADHPVRSAPHGGPDDCPYRPTDGWAPAHHTAGTALCVGYRNGRRTRRIEQFRLCGEQAELLYAWAIAMGAGLDAQLIGSSVKVGRAARTGHPWQAVLYGVLVVALSYVAFIAAQVFATQQAYGITMSEALGRLGMDGTTWLVQRSILSVVLVG